MMDEVIQEEIVNDFVVVHHHKDTHEVPEYAAAPPGLSDIGEAVDGLAEELWPVNKKIHDNPELGFKEFIAHETLTTLMRSKAGWKVTPSAYGMATAWVAAYDSGKRGPVVSFNVEMGSFLFAPQTLVQKTLSIINCLANAGCFISFFKRRFTGNWTRLRSQPHSHGLGSRGFGYGGDHEAAQFGWQGGPIRNTGGRRLVVLSLGNVPPGISLTICSC